MSEPVAGVLALAAAFALGSLPSAYIAARVLAGVDIREIGSGNPGALNAGDRLGKMVGVLVLLADAGKGVLAVALAQRLAAGDGWVYASAFLAVAGHNFSPFLRFRGGKGAATALGAAAYILPGATALSIISVARRQALGERDRQDALAGVREQNQDADRLAEPVAGVERAGVAAADFADVLAAQDAPGDVGARQRAEREGGGERQDARERVAHADSSAASAPRIPM